MRQPGVGIHIFALAAFMVLFAVPALSASSAPAKQLAGTVVKAPGNGQKAEDHTWIQLEATPHPAYVGIHGGTAPITLVRTKNGELVALTGETGSDFTRLLLGHNASHAAGNNASSTSARETAPKDESSTASSSAPHLATLADDTGDKHSQAAITPAPTVKQTHGQKQEKSPARQSLVVLPDSIAEKPGNYPSPVFANEHGTPSLDAHESLASFGLSLADTPPAILVAQDVMNRGAQPRQFTAKPLVLKDYRRLLSLR